MYVLCTGIILNKLEWLSKFLLVWSVMQPLCNSRVASLRCWMWMIVTEAAVCSVWKCVTCDTGGEDRVAVPVEGCCT